MNAFTVNSATSTEIPAGAIIVTAPLDGDKLRRIEQSLAETINAIEKEEKYPEHLRKDDYLATMRSHRDKLMNWIERREWDFLRYV